MMAHPHRPGTIIDFHTHAFNDQLAPMVMAEFADQFNFQAHYDGTVSGLLAHMAQCGVEQAVLQPVATKTTQVQVINRWCQNIRSKEKIHCFGALHPEMEDEAIEQEVAFFKATGIRGVKLHPEYQSFFPDEDRMSRIYTALEEAGLILLFHSGKDLCFHGEVKATPRRLLQVHRSFPRLKLVLAHLGGFQLWKEVARELVGQSLWLDTAFCPGYCPADQFEEIVAGHGAEQILFGSDAPWGNQQAHINYILDSGLTREEKHRILGKNALELLAITR